MKTKRLITFILLLTLALGISACTQLAAATSDSTTQEPTVATTQQVKQTAVTTPTTWDDSATLITLADDASIIEGNGAQVKANHITIDSSGTYVVSGSLSDGSIAIVNADNETIHLVLNGVDITNKSGAPLYADKTDVLIITLADGTTNTLTDGGASFQYVDSVEEEPNGALFSKDDLTINGEGALTVNAGFNNGIVSKDHLLIESGNITVNAANHAIRGNDSITILNGTFKLSAGNDGMQTNNTDDATLGWIEISDGAFEIEAAHDGIQSDTSITITGGQFDITTGVSQASSSDSDSYKAIKATTDIQISEGTFTIVSADDAIHANGSIAIQGGTFTIASADDGIHADERLDISGGSLLITESYEGLEAAHITISGGEIDITASDDAINAAGGNTTSGGMEMGMGNRPGFGDGDYSITVTGGTIRFFAGGDGFDSNGSLTISGGTIYAFIASTPDNGALDADGTITITGGTLIYGGSGIGYGAGNASTQSYVLTTNVTKGSTLSLKQNEQTIISYTAERDLTYLAFSSPDITYGETYEIYSGDTLIGSAQAGTGGQGMGGPGGMMPQQGGNQQWPGGIPQQPGGGGRR